MAVLRPRRSAVRARMLPRWVRRDVSRLAVESCSDGTLRVTPRYVRFEDDGDRVILPPSLLTRAALAKCVEEALNRCLGVAP